MTNKQIEQIEQIEKVEEQEKGVTIMKMEEIEQGKPMFTINRDMAVVETTETWSNPLSSDRDMMKLFLDNNRETLESSHNSDDNYGLSFYACGYSGRAQDEFVQGWADSGVLVF